MNTLSKTTLLSVAACLSTTTSLFAQDKIKPPIDVSTATATDKVAVKEDMSYGLGFQNGEQFASYGFIAEDIDKEAYVKGLMEALLKKDFGKDPVAYDQAMKAYDMIVSERERAFAKANEAAEKAFLEKNGKRKEVITTGSELQYEILTKGTGKKYTPPTGSVNGMDNATEFHLKCKGTLLDGTIFMETPGDEAMPFNLQVIHGLAEALKMMPIGSKWKLYVPAALGFGELRQGPKISPNSMLIYEVELTDIKTRPMQPTQHQPLVPR
ncbi:MAG: FKBP-type peptidyl-prolyl cis-trans isomerase N-terminal domain-containing protein [Akkermansiaceae bacterium]